jgi:hypothetical protein
VHEVWSRRTRHSRGSDFVCLRASEHYFGASECYFDASECYFDALEYYFDALKCYFHTWKCCCAALE